MIDAVVVYQLYSSVANCLVSIKIMVLEKDSVYVQNLVNTSYTLIPYCIVMQYSRSQKKETLCSVV